MPRKNDLLVWASGWSGNKNLCMFMFELRKGLYDAPDLTRRNLSLWKGPEMWVASSAGEKKDFTFTLPMEYST